jgi:hypothetical protein
MPIKFVVMVAAHPNCSIDASISASYPLRAGLPKFYRTSREPPRGFDECGHTWVGHDGEVFAEIACLLMSP